MNTDLNKRYRKLRANLDRDISARDAENAAYERAAQALDNQAAVCREEGRLYDAGEWDYAAEIVRALKR